MWKEYKKRFVTTQIVIALGIAVAWQFNLPPRQLLMAFIAMQVGAVFGAAMGARLKKQIERANDDDLPLKK